MCKPAPAIYQTCIERLDVPADTTLFVDDRVENLRGAESVGLQTFHFTGDGSIGNSEASSGSERCTDEESSLGTRLRELSLVFLKLGVIGFGGPAAHIALMEMEVVRRRGWLSRDQFLDLVGATNLIPGPNSTELAIHIGRIRAGLPGLLTAGAAFILPAFCIVSASRGRISGMDGCPDRGAAARNQARRDRHRGAGADRARANGRQECGAGGCRHHRLHRGGERRR